MRGYKHYNFPAFDTARDRLIAKGYDVISPADLDREAGHHFNDVPDDYDWTTIPETFSLKAAVKRDIDAILRSDGICMLPGWEQSCGALAELAVAQWLGLKVMTLEVNS
jgi:hypothetical protein